MNYVSFLFLIYVAVVCSVYFLYPIIFRKYSGYQWVVLLLASCGFYALCAGAYLFLIVWTSAMIWLGAQILQRLSDAQSLALKGEAVSILGISLDKSTGKLSREDKKQIRRQFTDRRRLVLWSVLVVTFGILAFFKYIPGVVSCLSQGRQSLSLIIPVGISFYTFQATGYLIDVYNGNVRAERNFLKTALFISFFPQIIQGPIGFWNPIAGQLFAEHRFDWKRFKYGCELILWGYLRKMVLADRIVNDIYLVTDSYTQYSGSMVILAVLLYAVQLYADFAGGIDISRGIAQILGIELPENFRQPYLAVSINDYWRRWHITLGAWMKRYIFYPLALTPWFSCTGKKLGKTRFGSSAYGKHVSKVLPASLSCIVVFLVVGIWHGAGWRYVAFGLWNGCLIFLSMLLEPLFPAWRRAFHLPSSGKLSGGYRLFQILRTFLIVFIGYIFDVAQNFCSAMGMMARMVTHFQWNPMLFFSELCSTYENFNSWNVMIILAVTFLMVLADLYHERHDPHAGGDGVRLRESIDRGSFLREWVLVLFCICAIVLLGMYGPGYNPVKFVYANF